ncbi:hypothetical protein MHBO_003808, partial [Bonamia ostreae]
KTIVFFAARNIKRGEELSFDYNYETLGENISICHCGSENCRGSISSIDNNKNIFTKNTNFKIFFSRDKLRRF